LRMFGSELKRRFEVRLTLTHEDKNNYMALRTVRSNHIGQVCVLVCVCLCVEGGCVRACALPCRSPPYPPPPHSLSLSPTLCLVLARSLLLLRVIPLFHSLVCVHDEQNTSCCKPSLCALHTSTPLLLLSHSIYMFLQKMPNRACALPLPCTSPTHF